MNFYNSKMQTAYECPMKFHFCYRERIVPKVTGPNLLIGAGFHTGAHVFGKLKKEKQGIPPGAKIALASQKIINELDNTELSDVSITLLDALCTDPQSNFAQCKFHEFEQTYAIKLSKDVTWLIRPDSILTVPGDTLPSMGEYKSSSGYGPKMQVQFHRDPQVWGYFMGLVKFVKKELLGIQMFIVTKTKIPKVFSEPILGTEHRMKQAWENISNGIKHVQMVEREGLKGKNRYACFGRYGACEYLSLCEYDNEEYNQTLKESSFKEYNPEEHLELEKAKEVIVDV